MRARSWPMLVVLVGGALVGSACGDDGGSDGGADSQSAELFDPTDDGGEDDTTGGPPAIVPGEATDLCDAAYAVDEGAHFGTLRGRQADLDGACGTGGPDAFFRVDVPRRSDVWLDAHGVGFTPRVGVLPATCVDQWFTRTLLCTQGVGGWILDVAAGSSLVVSVGIDADDPAIVSPVATEGSDALDFRLDVTMRDVLEIGAGCTPAGKGRCGAGTACRPGPDGSPAVCTLLEGDTCATAAPLQLELGTSTLTLDPETPQTDAHTHSCGGARHPERVVALSLPITDDPPSLQVRASSTQVGLALRGNDCDLAGELACAPPSDALPSITTTVPSEAGRPLLLFIELPLPIQPDAPSTPAGEEPPIVVTFELTSSG